MLNQRINIGMMLTMILKIRGIITSEAKVPKFFRWIAVAAVDVWGFITSADVDITWNDGVSVTVSFDLNEALENAGEASSSV